MARHSQIDKRARRTIPKQCVADFGGNTHKDATRKDNSCLELSLRAPKRELPLGVARWHHALHQITGAMARCWNSSTKEDRQRWATELKAIAKEMEN